MKEEVKKLYHELQQAIRYDQQTGAPATNHLGDALKSIQGIVARLKTAIVRSGFRDDAEEIDFARERFRGNRLPGAVRRGRWRCPRR